MVGTMMPSRDIKMIIIMINTTIKVHLLRDSRAMDMAESLVGAATILKKILRLSAISR